MVLFCDGNTERCCSVTGTQNGAFCDWNTEWCCSVTGTQNGVGSLTRGGILRLVTVHRCSYVWSRDHTRV